MADKKPKRVRALEWLGAVRLRAAREATDVLLRQFEQLEHPRTAGVARELKRLLAPEAVNRLEAGAVAYRVLQAFLSEWKADKRLKPDDLERAATFLELMAKDGGDLTLGSTVTRERLARISATEAALFGSREGFENLRASLPPAVLAAIGIAVALQCYGAFIEPIEKGLERGARKKKPGLSIAERSRALTAFQAFLANNLVLPGEEAGLWGSDNAACRDALAHGDFEILPDGQVRTWMRYKRGPVQEAFTNGPYLLNLGVMFEHRNLMLHAFLALLALQLLFQDRLPPSLGKILPALEDVLRVHRNRSYAKLLSSVMEEE